MSASDADNCTRHELTEVITWLNYGDGEGVALTVGDTRGGGHELTEAIAWLNYGDGEGVALTVGDVHGDVGFFAHGITSRENTITVLGCCQYPIEPFPQSEPYC